MGRTKNDGRGRIGGRAKGTTNKPQEPLNAWALSLINKRRAQFEKDLDEMEPADRVAALVQLLAASQTDAAASTCGA